MKIRLSDWSTLLSCLSAKGVASLSLPKMTGLNAAEGARRFTEYKKVDVSCGRKWVTGVRAVGVPGGGGGCGAEEEIRGVWGRGPGWVCVSRGVGGGGGKKGRGKM